MTDAVTDQLSRLREPFPPSQVGKLPRGHVMLDFVGHGAVTDRLLAVDPEWNWEPMALTPEGLPLFDTDSNGQPIGLWIRLTVQGVTRLGYGDCLPGQFSSEKVLIGDALRNAAMRFGVALDLWIKGHAEDDERVSLTDDRQRASRRPSAPSPASSGADLCPVCGVTVKDGRPIKFRDGQRLHTECLEAPPAESQEPAPTADGEAGEPGPSGSPAEPQNSAVIDELGQQEAAR